MREIRVYEFYELSDYERHNFTGITKNDIGSLRYYENGRLHRTDGPAIVYPDDYVEYWINGIQTSKEAQEFYYSLMKLKGLI